MAKQDPDRNADIRSSDFWCCGQFSSLLQCHCLRTMTSTKGRVEPGTCLNVGTIVRRLCDLETVKGKELNDRIAQVVADNGNNCLVVKLLSMDGHVTREMTMRVQTFNVRQVCSSCLQGHGELKLCSNCAIARHCGATCQQEHWKRKPTGHKAECKLWVLKAEAKESGHQNRTKWKKPSAEEENKEARLFHFLAEQHVLLVKGQLEDYMISMLNAKLAGQALPWDEHVEKELRMTPELKRAIVRMKGTEQTEILVAFLNATVEQCQARA